MRVLALDVGFAATGVAVFENRNGWELVHVGCIRVGDGLKRIGVRQAEEDVLRIMSMSRDIDNLLETYFINGMVAELPHGGARSGRAMRAMGMASAMVGTIVEISGLPCEWYTPNETRTAAVGRWQKVPKQEVVAAMAKKYPKLLAIKNLQERENAADAVATFEAARNGNIVKGGSK